MKDAKAADEPVIAYKAFDARLICRGFKYEIGKTYEHKGRVELCESGFHACEVPFDAWNYYPGAAERARVRLEKIAARAGDDSKIVAAKITIEASLNLPDWIKAQVDTVLGLCRAAKGRLAAEPKEAAAATGDRGHAAATGYSGHAAATGYSGHAAATGDSGHAAATGEGGHAAATGEGGTAMAGLDGWVVLAHWRYDDAAERWIVVTVRSAKVGGPEGIKPNTSYRLDDNGEFAEAEA